LVHESPLAQQGVADADEQRARGAWNNCNMGVVDVTPELTRRV
jgi:hypothetical protein